MDGRTLGSISKGDGSEVSDPTDWLGTPLASLMQVEQSLRCHVCKEFFNSPLITSCSHTFCSLCIRRALNTDGKCPLCRATDQESKLRGNWAVREAADAFVASRTSMLELARHPPGFDDPPPTASPKRKASEEPLVGEPAPKKKAHEDSTVERRTTRSASSSVRSSRVTRAANAASRMQEEVDEADAQEADETPDDGLVACPICQWRMKAEKVYSHIDTDCPGEPRPQPNLSKPKRFGFAEGRPTNSIPSAPPERLPSTNYSILNDTKLRKKLSDQGIPAWGPRLLLEKRHKEWVMIWNANCDSSRPKSKRELLQDLDTWERTQGGMASTQSLAATRTAQIKDKDFDGASWSAEHNDSFSELIARARKSHKKAAGPSIDAQPSTEGAKGTGEQHRTAAEAEHNPNSSTAVDEDQSLTPSTAQVPKSSEMVDQISLARPREVG